MDEDELEAVAASLDDGSMLPKRSTDIRHVSILLGKDLVDESGRIFNPYRVISYST